MAPREPSVVERHILAHFVPYAVAFGLFGVLTAVLGVRDLSSDVLLGVIKIVLGVMVATGPWTSLRRARQWDAATGGREPGDRPTR